MTWARIDDRAIDGPDLLALTRGVRHMHIEGIVWCCRHETDGVIPRHAIGKVTDEPEADKAAAQLVDAGLWAETDTGWEIVDFLAVQRSKEDIDKVREFAVVRQRRQRQHQAGDHSLCDPKFCRVAASRVTERVSNGVSHDTLTRPDLTSREGREGRAGARPPKGSAGAPARGEKTTPRAFTLSGPPPVDQLCDHGRDQRICHYCRQEASA